MRFSRCQGYSACLIALLYTAVFKIFVANPSKSRPIVEILARNKVKLMDFLVKFQTEKGTSVWFCLASIPDVYRVITSDCSLLCCSEDEQFNEEKKILLSALAKLEEPKPDDGKSAAAGAPASASSTPAPAGGATPAPGPSAVSGAAAAPVKAAGAGVKAS